MKKQSILAILLSFAIIFLLGSCGSSNSGSNQPENTSFRLISTQHSIDQIDSFTYNAKGQMIQKRVRNTQSNHTNTIAYTYNSIGQRIQIRQLSEGNTFGCGGDYSTQTQAFTYNNNGQITSEVKECTSNMGSNIGFSRTTYTYTYNDQQQLTQRVDGVFSTRTFSYNDSQQLSQRILFTTLPSTETTTYTYNDNGQFIRIQRIEKSVDGNTTNTSNFEYNALGQITRLQQVLINADGVRITNSGSNTYENQSCIYGEATIITSIDRLLNNATCRQ